MVDSSGQFPTFQTKITSVSPHSSSFLNLAPNSPAYKTAGVILFIGGDPSHLKSVPLTLSRMGKLMTMLRKLCNVLQFKVIKLKLIPERAMAARYGSFSGPPVFPAVSTSSWTSATAATTFSLGWFPATTPTCRIRRIEPPLQSLSST